MKPEITDVGRGQGAGSRRGKSLHWEGAGDRISNSPDHPKTQLVSEMWGINVRLNSGPSPKSSMFVGAGNPFLDCTPSNSLGPLRKE